MLPNPSQCCRDIIYYSIYYLDSTTPLFRLEQAEEQLKECKALYEKYLEDTSYPNDNMYDVDYAYSLRRNCYLALREYKSCFDANEYDIEEQLQRFKDTFKC